MGVVVRPLPDVEGARLAARKNVAMKTHPNYRSHSSILNRHRLTSTFRDTRIILFRGGRQFMQMIQARIIPITAKESGTPATNTSSVRQVGN